MSSMTPQEQPDSQAKTLLDDWAPIFVNGVIPTEFREWCRKQWIGNVVPDSQAGDEPSKYCSHCDTTKPLSEWHYYPSENRYNRRCKDCQNKRTQNYYIANRDTRKEKFVAYKQSEAGKRVAVTSHKNAIERYPEKFDARRRATYAVKKGLIPKLPCEDCGEAKVEAHHYKGYSKEHALDIKWLCRKHHRDAHKFSLESRGLV